VRPFVAAILVADTISIMLTRNIASFLPLIDLTGQDCSLVIAVAEIASPVLFGGHIGIPGRDTHGAVIQGTPGVKTFRAVLGLHELAAVHRAMRLHGCQAGDAAVVFALHRLPAVVGALPDVHHGRAMGIDLLERLIAVTHIALHDDGTAAQCHTD